METGKVDRRVKYTKALLRGALAELMQKQHISGISVKALCDLADVNRSTFYAHYTDVYDLLHQIEREVLEDLRGYIERPDEAEPPERHPISMRAMTRVLEYLKENAELFRALLSENCDFAFQKDIMTLAEVITAKSNPNMPLRMREYLQEFGIAGCISTINKWLRDGMIETPAQISDFILQASYYGIGNYWT